MPEMFSRISFLWISTGLSRSSLIEGHIFGLNIAYIYLSIYQVIDWRYIFVFSEMLESC